MRPDDFWSYYRLGEAQQQWSKLELALASYDRALDLEPDDYWTWYQKGIIEQELDNLSKAIAYYDRAITLDSKSDTAYYKRACCYALLKNTTSNTNQAIINLEKAIDLYPEKYIQLAIDESIWHKFHRQKGFQLLVDNKSRLYDLKMNRTLRGK